MNQRPSVRSLFSGHRTTSMSLAKRTSSITSAIRTASVGTAYVGNSKFHLAIRNSNEPDSPGSPANENFKRSPMFGKEKVSKKDSGSKDNANKKSPYFARSPSWARKNPFVSSPFISRRSLPKKNANLAKESPLTRETSLPSPSVTSPSVTSPSVTSPSLSVTSSTVTTPDVTTPPSVTFPSDDEDSSENEVEVIGTKVSFKREKKSPKPDRDSKSDDRLSVSELFAVYSRITRRKLSKQDAGRAGHGTWGYRGYNAKPRPSLLDSSSPFSTLPRNCPNPTLQGDLSNSPSNEELSLMSLAYAKLLKLRKQKEELKRIYSMLDDLENDFMGSKENNTFIERYMEVKVKKDYMLSPGNPESTVEKEDTIKVFGYMGHNTWRILGPHCKGYCMKGTVVNPRIRSQNQVADVDIVCNSCNKITVPLIGSVPTSILHMRNANNHSPG